MKPKKRKKASKASLKETKILFFKWNYYSTYHPSNDPDEIMHDFWKGVPLKDAYTNRGLEIPKALAQLKDDSP